MTLILIIAVIALLISLNALYVAAEFATISSRRARLQTLANEGSSSAKQLLPYVEDPERLDRYIAACQVGITLSSLIVGFYGQAQLTPYIGFGLSTAVTAVLVLILLTALQVIFGELIPKSVAMRYPERFALLTARPLIWSLKVLRPLISLFNGSAFVLMRMFGLELGKGTHAHSPEELEFIFRESAQGGYLDHEEKEMLENVLRFETRLARQIMVPRVRMVSVDVTRKPGELLKELVETPHMRFPVYEGSVDNIIGVLNLKDLFAYAQTTPNRSFRSIIRDVPILPETNTVNEVWDELKRRQSHMAVLFDEYGGVVGMVTLEDIIEEIVGEVQDEFDSEDKRIERRGDKIFLRGDVLIATLNRKFLLSLPENEADTVGGMMFEELEHTPEVGDRITLNDLTFEVEAVNEGAASQISVLLQEDSLVEQVILEEVDASSSNAHVEDTVAIDMTGKDTIDKKEATEDVSQKTTDKKDETP